MKKAILLIALMWALVVAAKPVASDMAAVIAQRYFPEVVDITPQGWTELYVFAPTEGEGFVVVSADDCTVPVLAFSPTQSFDTTDLPPHVASWFDGYRREVASLRAAGVTPSKKVIALWRLAKGSSTDATVGPLITTQWGQSSLYKSHCPVWPGTSDRVVTGCVATATAQVMKYWNHPIIGYGTHTYTASGIGVLSVDFDTAYWWSQMPNKLNSRSSSTQVAAVAQLMYHVGVSVSMSYGLRSSGAQVTGSRPSAEKALKSYFRYSPALRGVYKSDYTDAAWTAMMKAEIDHRRPVLYAGYDGSGGHAFVVDGYNQTGSRYYFHINWGWGGGYDGYFTLDSLSPGGGGTGGNATYTFNMSNEAVVGIQPSEASMGIDVSVVDVVSANPDQGTVSGSGRYTTYRDNVVIAAEAAEGYRFDRWSSEMPNNPQVITVNGDYTDTAFFCPLGTDTLGYSRDAFNSPSSGLAEWGIRIPAHLRPHQRNLQAIQCYIFASGDYTIKVYRGDTASTATLVYSQPFYVRSLLDWVTIPLDSAIYVDNHSPLWVTLSYRGTGYPVARAAYAGNADGSWYRTRNKWQQWSSGNERYTWMLRAIFAPRPTCQFLIATATAMADSSEVPPMCIATGDGLYGEDSLIVLQAIADTSHSFLYWLDPQGDTIRSNPYTFYPSRNATYTAVFKHHQLSVGTVEQAKAIVSIVGRSIRVTAPAATTYSIVDCLGRVVASARGQSSWSATVASAGPYIVVVGGKPYKVFIQ